MPLEHQVEWETLVFQLIMHKIQEEIGHKGSGKLVKSALDLVWGMSGPFDGLNIIDVFSPVNN